MNKRAQFWFRWVRMKKQFWLFVTLGVLWAGLIHDPAAIARSAIPPSNYSVPAPANPIQFPLTSPPNADESRARFFTEPKLMMSYAYYTIQGNSVEDLNEQMYERSPLRQKQGNAFAALTHWTVDWTYTPLSDRQGCHVTHPRINVQVSTTLPYLDTRRSSAQPSFLREWQRYLQALHTHEEGHRQNGVAAGHELKQWLEQPRSARSCTALKENVRQVAQRITANYRQKDWDYDRRTHHGSTQGAILKRIASERA